MVRSDSGLVLITGWQQYSLEFPCGAVVLDRGKKKGSFFKENTDF